MRAAKVDNLAAEQLRLFVVVLLVFYRMENLVHSNFIPKGTGCVLIISICDCITSPTESLFFVFCYA